MDGLTLSFPSVHTHRRGITRKEAVKYLPGWMDSEKDMDPYFPEEAFVSEEHVRYMLNVVWPVLWSYRKVIVAQRAMSTYTALAMFAVGNRSVGRLGAGHVHYRDYFGKGKTLLAEIPAKVVGATYARFQGTPDALPADYTGNNVIQVDPETNKRYFKLMKGPAFSDIQLIDEANRTNPRTQSAFLPVIDEGKVIIRDGEDKFEYVLDPPPFVILTTNPYESEGVYPMSEALNDRIMFQVRGEIFVAHVYREILERTDTYYDLKLRQVCDIKDVQKIRHFFHKTIHVSSKVRDFIGRVVERMNTPHEFGLLGNLEHEFGGEEIIGMIKNVIQGRGVVHLEGASRALAAFRYRNYVTIDDVYKVILPVMRHRVLFAPGVIAHFNSSRHHKDADDTVDFILKELIREVW